MEKQNGLEDLYCVNNKKAKNFPNFEKDMEI